MFYISNMLGEKKKTKQKPEVSPRANNVNKHFDWLIF